MQYCSKLAALFRQFLRLHPSAQPTEKKRTKTMQFSSNYLCIHLQVLLFASMFIFIAISFFVVIQTGHRQFICHDSQCLLRGSCG